jgi:hypothetical protein
MVGKEVYGDTYGNGKRFVRRGTSAGHRLPSPAKAIELGKNYGVPIRKEGWLGSSVGRPKVGTSPNAFSWESAGRGSDPPTSVWDKDLGSENSENYWRLDPGLNRLRVSDCLIGF